MNRNKASYPYMLALFALFFVFVFAAQMTRAEQTEMTQTPPRATSSPMATSPGTLPPYVIQVGDEFDVKSYWNPEIDEHLIVRPDGHVALPIVGDVLAVGLTPEQLASQLTQKYSSEFKQPEVAVILRAYGNEKVYVAGEVNKPGLVNIVGRLTALQAISMAEGFKEDTARKTEVMIIRRGPDGRPIATQVNLKAAIKGADIAQDIQLQPFDVVYVPTSRITNVNRWINQYIRQNIPIPFSFSYRLDNKSVP